MLIESIMQCKFRSIVYIACDLVGDGLQKETSAVFCCLMQGSVAMQSSKAQKEEFKLDNHRLWVISTVVFEDVWPHDQLPSSLPSGKLT